MNEKQRKQSAARFAKEWEGRGQELQDDQSFWRDLLQDVLGMQSLSSKLKFQYRTPTGGYIDCYIPDSGVIIEQKSINVNLDKREERQGRQVTPFEQALAYAESFPLDKQPRFIVVCNFETFRIHDRNKDKSKAATEYVEFKLSDFPEQSHLLDFIIDSANSRIELEKKISMEAGRLIGQICEALREQYIDSDTKENRHALNVLCVRIVFCLFCEDAGLFPKDEFFNYLQNVEPDDMRDALKKLFKALNTPVNERDPYDKKIRTFPYVNGGLFAEEVEIPNFTTELKKILLDEASIKTNWSGISPTIFGGIFESTLNPETRRSGGMHYTSIENIHKVIDPLFLDALREEFDKIRSEEGITDKKRRRNLEEFRNKISTLTFFDPACGSGNFLTETYLCLRDLEDDILNILHSGQKAIAWDDDTSKRVSLDQFYGIEINDFAVSVAKTALWIAYLQKNNNSEMLFDVSIDDFPLIDSANIIQGNALRTDWNEVLPAEKCSYIMGNPPFVGHQWRTKEQQEDMDIAFNQYDKYGKLDYVCAWYALAQKYIRDLPIHCAFVSTNSICQGEPVQIIWGQLFEKGLCINFAYPSFVWGSDATDKAHVHVVIVGFSNNGNASDKKIIFYDGIPKTVDHINGYLFDAPDVFIENRSRPCNKGVPEMTKGSQPTDGGFLILTEEEKKDLLEKYPNLKEVIHPYIGGREFINGLKRYCLWFYGKKLSDYDYPEIRERLKFIKKQRTESPTASVREAASTPALFTQIRQPKNDYLAIPEVSSERRKYIPVSFIDKNVIASNQLRFIPTDSLYVMGLLLSKAHMAWMRIVAGRLEMRYRYSPAVYNSFVFPNPTNKQCEKIEKCAQNILDARAKYPDSSLADMYDPDNEYLYPDLIKAHKALDKAVEEAYGVNFNGDEEKIVAHLFKLYAEMTGKK